MSGIEEWPKPPKATQKTPEDLLDEEKIRKNQENFNIPNSIIEKTNQSERLIERGGEIKELKEEIKKIGEKIIDINEFIVKKTVSDFPDEKKAKENIIKMTYHDPCHLKKSLNVVNEPRILIKQNKKYDFIEMEDSDRCCGMGGSFSITHYNISEKIAEKKIENIKKTKAKVVSTACPACMMQLSDALSKIEDKIKVKHSIEIYADSLKESVVSG